MKDNIVPVVDHKKEVKYWIETLNNENITRKNKDLINEVLEKELHSYINPPSLLKFSSVVTHGYEYDKQEAIASFGYIISHCLPDKYKEDKRVLSHIEAVASFLRNN